MAKLARHGDVGQGTCTHPSHNNPVNTTGTIIASTSVLLCEGKQAALHGDLIQSTCGHFGTLIATTGVLTVGNKKAVRIGDQFIGDFTGIIISGGSIVDSI